MFSDIIERLKRDTQPEVSVVLSQSEVQELLTALSDARRWQAVRDGSYELLHNLSTAPAQYREQIIDEVSKI